ncbi:MAG TPA: DUF4158 domain-containing protein, partial [Gammaproteobacteria bacterium]|nr:DUF4158 domain-containing protein [Gammaproteobacteria bacterium]
FAQGFRGDVNRNAVALLLKSLLYLGYFPESLVQVPESVRTFIANQLGLLWDHTPLYRWQSGTKDHHLSLIREYTGWRFPTARDKEELEQWLRSESAKVAPMEEELLERAYERLRALRIELPVEMELRRIVNAALSSFFQNLYQCISARLSGNVRADIDRLLVVASDEAVFPFDKLKPDPSAPGVDNLKKEVEKLQQLRGIGITADDLTDVPAKARHILSRRAKNERAGEMRSHPAPIRHTLMACFIHVRMTEVTDDIARMMLELIHKIERQTEKQLNRELLQDLTRVEGKLQILFRIAEAVVEKPEGTVREVIFPRVKEEVFRNLLTEFKASGPQYRLIYQYFMHNKYARHYRRMLPILLENLTFRSDNRFQPVIEALSVIKR